MTRIALTGGEDYEVCFTAPPGSVEEHLVPFWEAFSLPLTRVGRVEEGAGVYLQGPDGGIGPFEVGGFSHFRDEEGV